MIRHAHTLSLAALAALAAGCAATMDDMSASSTYERPETTDLLANGLDGFDIRGGANWSYADGVAEADSGEMGFLFTKEAYGDFELSLEFYVGGPVDNSGVYFRCDNMDALADTTCYEANIYDDRPDQSGRTGGIPNYLPPTVSLDSAGKWNFYTIRAEGDHIKITLNGVVTVDGHDATHAGASPIGFQWGAGTVKFRNMKIERL